MDRVSICAYLHLTHGKSTLFKGSVSPLLLPLLFPRAFPLAESLESLGDAGLQEAKEACSHEDRGAEGEGPWSRCEKR